MSAENPLPESNLGSQDEYGILDKISDSLTDSKPYKVLEKMPTYQSLITILGYAAVIQTKIVYGKTPFPIENVEFHPRNR